MVKPSKSRREFFQMDMHKRAKTICGHLSKKLKKEMGKRSISIRKGDTVEIIRGAFKNKEGKVTKVNRAEGKIFVEKIIRKKSDGTEFEVAIDPSNVIVVSIDKADRKRTKRKNKKSDLDE